ncbi:MAG: hypothetical protein AAFR52_08825 [Pseudomonadota bacterium]
MRALGGGAGDMVRHRFAPGLGAPGPEPKAELLPHLDVVGRAVCRVGPDVARAVGRVGQRTKSRAAMGGGGGQREAADEAVLALDLAGAGGLAVVGDAAGPDHVRPGLRQARSARLHGAGVHCLPALGALAPLAERTVETGEQPIEGAGAHQLLAKQPDRLGVGDGVAQRRSRRWYSVRSSDGVSSVRCTGTRNVRTALQGRRPIAAPSSGRNSPTPISIASRSSGCPAAESHWSRPSLSAFPAPTRHRRHPCRS